MNNMNLSKVLLFGLVLTILACGNESGPSQSNEEGNQTPQVSVNPTPVPEAPLTQGSDVDDQSVKSGVDEVSLQQLLDYIRNRGSKPLIINVWATTCEPCVEEMPYLVELYEKYRNERIDFLALSTDYLFGTTAKVPEFIKKLNMTLPVKVLVTSDQNKAINSLHPNWQGDLPVTFVYNGEGERVKSFFGPQTKETFEQAIQSVMN